MDADFLGKQFDKELWDFNKSTGKRIIADVGPKIYKMLSTGTEPFFRRDMGERYFDAAAASRGYVLWIFATIASCFTGTGASLLFTATGSTGLANSFQGPFVPFVVGFAVLIGFGYFANENMKHLQQFRADGKTYHSKSRGQARTTDRKQELIIRIGGSVGLLLLAPVVGVAFIASMYVSMSLASQQQAALHDRYLDMLDAQIEGEFLQDAILGKCPPEITYLYKPLPSTMKPELREDIAAAAVGKPVKIVAQAPQPRSSATTPIPAMQS